ncbi:MAG: hypothetical protein IPN06_09980 [Burkholderiales bacterium]|nr:hypothetical protein [Burkholderiales bacterium]
MRYLEHQQDETELEKAATPAPVKVANDGPAVEGGKPAATGPKFSMTKTALIAAHEHEWPNIRMDILGAANNGLNAARAGPWLVGKRCIGLGAKATDKSSPGIATANSWRMFRAGNTARWADSSDFLRDI